MQYLKNIDDPFITAHERMLALEQYLASRNHFLRADKALSEIDLHLHTHYSDGYWTPAGLILEAYHKGMKLVALTDHDVFTGIEEVFSGIKVIRESTGVDIGFVPGIELSTDYYYGPDKRKQEIHILGYFPAPDFNRFEGYLKRLDNRTKAYMEAFRKNRVLRIYEMVAKFNQELPSKIPLLAKLKEIRDPIISDKTVTRGMRNSLAPGRLPTSTGIYDLYQAYVNGRLNEIENETFSRQYLEGLKELCGNSSSAEAFIEVYFDKKEPSAVTDYIGITEGPDWAVKTIVAMGGVAVLAHPLKYTHLFQELLELLVPLGLKGVEVFSGHIEDGKGLKNRFAFIKTEFPDLVVTLGSDCHGSSVDKKIIYKPEKIMGLSSDSSINLKAYFDEIYALFDY